MHLFKTLNSKHFLLSFVFLLLLPNAEMTAIYADTHIPSINKAETLLHKGQYLMALGMFKEIARYSNNRDLKARAIFYSGKTYSIYLDQQDTALHQFNKVIDHYPKSQMAEPALLNCGLIYFNQKNYRNAFPFFIDYLKKHPDGRYIDSAKKWADTSREKMRKQKSPKNLKTVIRKNSIENTFIRVLIRKQKKEIKLESKKTIQISNSNSGKMIYSGWGPVTLEKRGQHIFLNDQKIYPVSLHISSDVTAMKIDNQYYRGFFAVSIEPEGFFAVNHAPLESYLCSVVPKEMPNSWAMHALMAQAVAARTYSLYMKEKNRHRPYDLEATTSSQVYGGYSAENKRSTNAVNATSGQVMTYDGRLILAYFHSNSGGYTEDPVNVWDTNIPYLRGVPDRFSKNTPRNNWEYFLSYKEAKKRLNQYGLNIDRINQLKTSGRSKSGRNLAIQIISNNGIAQLNSNHFRESVGETKLKSTFFKIIPHTNGILFKGKGYGHGVGMSQWGANHMALSGANYKDILKHYYQGIDIVTLKG